MIQQNSASDDFTFPTVTTAADSSLSSSSPFWFLSAAAAPNAPAAGPDRGWRSRRNSFAEGLGRQALVLPAASNRDDGGSFLDDEERMDMLWEDLNDELGLKREDPGSSSDASGDRPALESVSDAVAKMDDLYCLGSLKMSKRRGALSQRKANLLVMLKVMKKLFLLQNSRYRKRV